MKKPVRDPDPEPSEPEVTINCVVGSNSGVYDELLYRENLYPFVESVTFADDTKYTTTGSF